MTANSLRGGAGCQSVHAVILSGVMKGLSFSEKPAFPNVERKKKKTLLALLSSGSDSHRKN